MDRIFDDLFIEEDKPLAQSLLIETIKKGVVSGRELRLASSAGDDDMGRGP